MIIINENYTPVKIKSLNEQIKSEYFWSLDLQQRDFVINRLMMLEEITAPVLSLKILNYKVTAPADWNILIYSDETMQLDVIQLSELTRGKFKAFLFDHTKNININNNISVIDYKSSAIVYVPTIQKTHMLCHAVGLNSWVCLSPTDNYNKFLRDATIGDIMP